MLVSIRFNRVTKIFDGERVVDDVSLNVNPGELFFLLGPSGCGKTTLLRCLAGFCRPDEGSVHVGDRDVTQVPPHKRDTGMVFQSYALWPHLTVSENIAFGLEMRRVPKSELKRRVAEVIELVRLKDWATQKPNLLSGGQQQRVALARALVVRPQCLLLDEPLSNLDAKLRLDMRGEIRRICKEAGLTAIYVTHDQKEALSIADRLAVMEKGVIQQVGTPLDVYLRPANMFVASFIGETNFVAGNISKVDDQQLTIRTAIGDIVSRTPHATHCCVGENVTLSIRPETLQLGNSPPAIPNAFKGIVHDSVYLGEFAQHQVNLSVTDACADSEFMTLKAFDMNPRIVARDGTENAQVWFDPDDVVVLKT